ASGSIAQAVMVWSPPATKLVFARTRVGRRGFCFTHKGGRTTIRLRKRGRMCWRRPQGADAAAPLTTGASHPSPRAEATLNTGGNGLRFSGADQAGSLLSVPRLSEVIAALENLWPAARAESWDAVGTVVGDPDQEVTRVLFAVDPVQEIVDE